MPEPLALLSDGELAHLPGSIDPEESAVKRGPVADRIRAALNGLDYAFRAILVIALVLQLAIVLTGIVSRFWFDESLLWADEAAKLFLSLTAFVGGALAFRARHHTTVEFLTGKFSPQWRSSFAIGIDLLVLVAAVVVGYVSLDLLSISATSNTPILQINAAWLVLPLTVGLALTALFAVERLLYVYALRAVVPVACAVALLVGLVYAISVVPSLHLDNGAALGVMLIAFLLAVLLGLPVSFAMLLGSLTFLLISGVAPLIAVAQNTFDGTSNYILLTLPFFIWAGLIMEKGGISLRLVRFAMTLVGHMRGGLLQVVVLTIYMVSGISGSKIADVVAVGSVLRRELKRQGYRPEQGAAVLASSAAMSETIPPSLAMLVLGSVAPISIGTLFIAGLMPAAVIALLLMVLNYVLSRRDNMASAPRATSAELLRATGGAVLPLVMPVIMVIGIRFGVATPTEVSSVAVLYGLILAFVIYRAVDLKALYQIAVESCLLAGMVLFIIAAAFSFAWTLTAANLPSNLAMILHSLGDNRTVFILGSIVLLIVVGSLLEGLPALIILGPLLMPIAGQYGIDIIHYSMIMILAMGVGIFIPPIGIGFYVSCTVSESRLEATSRAMLPYLAVLIIGVLVVAFVPWFTLAVPRLIRGH
ncbi:TRAP transporter large permease [Bradyrhizobium canariense]|uniref:TRAP transporter, DctM subunit n=1 Tax=Bradyrhizobium canariense TaxID=255045 RepID=A0A1H1WMK9_9BRAD|nr:TRAP transporter large permease subunit [Bradyrhizobium canariense]SDS97831.1 TRAP transporter, DctM subunit [Bradyrhizobium canariense]